MRKFPICLMFISLLIIAGCGSEGPYTSTASLLNVVKKEHSEDYKEAWIIAFDPNYEEEPEEIKIIVKDPMVWNLIEVNKTYFTSYSKEGDNHWELEQINHLDDNDALR